MEPTPAAATWSSKTYSIPGGIEFFATDSGPPPNSNDYTTIILIHGAGFNGYSFQKLHSLAHTFNLRTVAFNRRDYSGSTPYTPEELSSMENGDKAFIDRLGMHLHEFLKCFVEEEEIPRISLDKRMDNGKHRIGKVDAKLEGGLVLVGWSLGAQTLLSMLSDFQGDLALVGPSPDGILLEEYVKDVVFYDPPYTAFGYSLPPDYDTSGKKYYLPWLDPENTTLDAAMTAYVSWTGSYFDHHFESESSNNGGQVQIDSQSKSTEKMTTWTEEDLKAGSELAVMIREAGMTAPPIQRILANLGQQVLFNDGPESVTESPVRRFAHAALTYISASRTIWISAWANFEMKRRYKAYLAMNKDRTPAKPIRFVDIQGANHFVSIWVLPSFLPAPSSLRARYFLRMLV
ncbi:hypothetical protein BT96DRAFT_874657 [Gymnopus androsaceus JB14]|uniref:AB hydrolase-1 domain-containing protein n=1 Tax=Gymnopus androsaceus JB14 TaxID=1447944 RepID=A0A6A4IC21_9AGAR|nr:hypothetical protein BT96DRAFT_874657 [Gymnopus androsaceus JB14]